MANATVSSASTGRLRIVTGSGVIFGIGAGKLVKRKNNHVPPLKYDRDYALKTTALIKADPESNIPAHFSNDAKFVTEKRHPECVSVRNANDSFMQKLVQRLNEQQAEVPKVIEKIGRGQPAKAAVLKTNRRVWRSPKQWIGRLFTTAKDDESTAVVDPPYESIRSASALAIAVQPGAVPVRIGRRVAAARTQPRPPAGEARLQARCAAIASVEQRAFTILVDLGMVELPKVPT